ncbi:MAG: TetR/AcrR family transcriptional regulator [Actinomycetota bacterium]
MRKKLTKRGSERRAELLEAGSRLFSGQGYHRTTVGDICDSIGVGKGVFYWYFRSKEALFSEILQDSLLQLRRAQQSAIADVQEPVERIEEGIKASIEFFRANPGFLGLIRTAARYEEFATLLENGQQIVVSDTATHLKEGMGNGSVREGDPELLAHGILGAIFHFVETYFGTEGEDISHRPNLADEAAAFCLRGLLAG